jgi:hypothetical protein
MADIEFMYKGKKIVIREKHPDAVISVDGREFVCHHHHEKDNKGLPMWMCGESYFASPDIRELARHFADYAYMFDDPNRVRVDDEGRVIEKGRPASPGGRAPGSGHHGGGRGQ